MQSFSIFLGLGTLAGLLLAGWRAPQKETIRYLDAAVITLFIALISSRAFAVLVNWGYYASHLGEIFQVWQGGLSSIGALVGGVLAICIVSSWWKLPLGLLADILLPLAGALAITSWLGCWMGACAYGLPSGSWLAVPARDEWGVLAERVPVQLIGALMTLVIIWVTDLAGRRVAIAGLTAAIGLFDISSVIFVLSYLRADPVPIWQGLRLEAWGSIGIMLLSGLIVVVLLVRWRAKKRIASDRRVS
ncbi:MAG TPA: prolipoprotein diacylglyceryl transferase family protein [Anaerolineales bacterium]|nr:prolipoprotein diacylglyceryl transferase family protein [Anaerolineales bacterium]